jgi:two-component system, sensor histidine kinase LadS
MKQKTLFLLCFCCFYTSVFSQPILTYSDAQIILKSGLYFQVYEDISKSITYKQLRSLPNNVFQQSTHSAPNFGVRKSKIWLKLTIDNQTNEPLFLLCDKPTMSYVEMYVADEKGKVFYNKSGLLMPYRTRFFENNQLTFPLGKHPKTLFIGISGDATLLASFYVAAQRPLTAWLHLNDTFEGAFLGWMILVFLYNLFIFFQLRDKIYLYYCLYLITCTFLAIRLEGIGYDLFWRNSTAFNRWIDIPGIINTIVVVFFATQFLQTKAILPRLYRVLLIFATIDAALSILELLNIRPLSNNAVMAGFLTGAVLLWYTGFAAWRKGLRQARFYLLGWSTFLVATIVTTLWRMGTLNENSWWVYNSLLLGIMSEAALFSFALADRIRIYRREADDACSLALQRLEENETLLLKHNLVLEKNLRLEQEGLKQSNIEELTKLMEQERGQIKRLSVPSMEGVLLLPLPDIIRLQALGSYCTIYLSHNKKIMASKPLADFESFLIVNGFLRVHKSHLINLHHVQRYVKGDGGTAVMSDGSEVSVSRGGKSGLMERLEIQ